MARSGPRLAPCIAVTVSASRLAAGVQHASGGESAPRRR